MKCNLFKKWKVLCVVGICGMALVFLSYGCDKNEVSKLEQAISESEDASKSDENNSNNTNTNQTEETTETVNNNDSNEKDPEYSNLEEMLSVLVSIIGTIDRVSISEIMSKANLSNEYESENDINPTLESGSIQLKKLEPDCLRGKCDAELTLFLHSIDGQRVSNDIAKKSLTTVTLSKSGVSGDLSHLCPKVSNKEVIFNMVLNYGGNIIRASDRSTLIGARADDKTVMLGVTDVKSSYNFYNLDTIITSISCPNVKKLTIRHLCEDTNLDNPTLRRCWTLNGADKNCPNNNIYRDSEYPAICRNISYPDDDYYPIIGVRGYEKMKDQLGPLSLNVKRVEPDCYSGKCNVTATFSLYSVNGTKVSDEVKEKSKTTVRFDKNGSTGELSHLCPLDNKKVILNMSLNYGKNTIDASDRSILIGGRVDKKAIMVGVADSDLGYNFHNVNTIITEIRCPDVKKLTIKGLCEDTNLDNPTLRRCWTVRGSDSSCPSSNIYSDSEYPVSCR